MAGVMSREIDPGGVAAVTADGPVYRLSVTQYHQMARAGILTEEEPFTASNKSEAEPDLMIVRGERNDYPDEPPRADALPLMLAGQEIARLAVRDLLPRGLA